MRSRLALLRLLILLGLTFISTTLIACGVPKDIAVTTKVKESNVVIAILEKNKPETANYQGYINMTSSLDEKYEKNLKQVIVKNIKFSTNDKGLPVMYRYNKPFDEQAVKIIYDETKKDNVYTEYEYSPNQFKNFGFEKSGNNEYTTKIQYLIMNVDTNTDKKQLKREVDFTMVYKFKNGNKIEKPVKVEIFK